MLNIGGSYRGPIDLRTRRLQKLLLPRRIDNANQKTGSAIMLIGWPPGRGNAFGNFLNRIKQHQVSEQRIVQFDFVNIRGNGGRRQRAARRKSII